MWSWERVVWNSEHTLRVHISVACRLLYTIFFDTHGPTDVQVWTIALYCPSCRDHLPSLDKALVGIFITWYTSMWDTLTFSRRSTHSPVYLITTSRRVRCAMAALVYRLHTCDHPQDLHRKTQSNSLHYLVSLRLHLSCRVISFLMQQCCQLHVFCLICVSRYNYEFKEILLTFDKVGMYEEHHSLI